MVIGPQRAEFQELSVFSQGGKRVDILVINPEALDDATGLMLALHGWGNNRYQYRDMMEDFSKRYNVVCISPEFRDSGFDASPNGTGIKQPYDFSHLQVIDTLSSLQAVRLRSPKLNDRRTFIWGGSQGGHIAVLATEFAPHTFALTIDACGIAYPTPEFWEKAGWHGEGAEFEIRDTRRFVDKIQNKVVLFHGIKDELVNVQESYDLETALRNADKEVEAHYYPNGDHFLRPDSSRMEATIEHASRDLLTRRIKGENDFSRGGQTPMRCTGCKYVIDFRGELPQLREERE